MPELGWIFALRSTRVHGHRNCGLELLHQVYAPIAPRKSLELYNLRTMVTTYKYGLGIRSHLIESDLQFIQFRVNVVTIPEDISID